MYSPDVAVPAVSCSGFAVELQTKVREDFTLVESLITVFRCPFIIVSSMRKQSAKCFHPGEGPICHCDCERFANLRLKL